MIFIDLKQLQNIKRNEPSFLKHQCVQIELTKRTENQQRERERQRHIKRTRHQHM